MKDWRQLLNNAQVDLSEYSEYSLTDVEKMKLKNNLRKKIVRNRKNNYKKIAVSIVAVLGVASVVKSNVIADRFDIMNDKKYSSSNSINNFKNYSDSSSNNYRNIVEQSVNNNGLTLTINEVIFDYKNIIITYTLDSNVGKIQDINISPKILINDKEINIVGESQTYSDKSQNLKQITLEPKYPINEVGEFDMKIVIGGEKDFYQDEIIENGIWEFNFKVSKLDINKATKLIDINENIKLDSGLEIFINKVIVTPISTTVEMESENMTKEEMSKYISIDCIIEDSKGNILDTISQNTKNDYLESKGTHTSRFKNISEDSTSIKITPIVLFDSYYDQNNEYNKSLKECSIDINLNKGNTK